MRHNVVLSAALVLTVILASCGQTDTLTSQNNKTNAEVDGSKEMVFTNVTDEQLNKIANEQPELRQFIHDFIIKSNTYLKNSTTSTVAQPQSILGGGISSCRGEVDMSNLGTTVKATFETSCWGSGTRKVVASQARLRFENITANSIKYDDGNNAGGNNYLVQYHTNTTGNQLFCAKGWLLLTYADGTKQQGQTDENYCEVY